jgi:hypothetical protein
MMALNCALLHGLWPLFNKKGLWALVFVMVRNFGDKKNLACSGFELEPLPLNPRRLNIRNCSGMLADNFFIAYWVAGESQMNLFRGIFSTHIH